MLLTADSKNTDPRLSSLADDLETVRDIKQKLCWVSPLEERDGSLREPTDGHYELPDAQSVTIGAEIRN